MKLFTRDKKSIKIVKVFLSLAFLFVLQISLGHFLIKSFSIDDTKKSLDVLTARIQNDLKYKNKSWDTRMYAADPYTPHPTGSSGFTTPLYILATDGFVIERNQPINGYLDSSDFKHILSFKSPQTI